MTINSAALFNAVNQKNIAEVNFALKTAIKDAQDIIQKNYKNEFDLIKWSNLPGNNADDIVLKARLRNAMNALDTTVKLNNFTCSIANLVACYLLYDDKYIKSETKSEWISILLDMIIIGCNYHIKNSNDRSIIECLTAYQSIEAEIEKAQLAAKATKQTQPKETRVEKKTAKVIKAGQILAAYNRDTQKFDMQKLVALKEIELVGPNQTIGHYQSFAEISQNVGLFGANSQSNKSDLRKSQDPHSEVQSPTPDKETELLLNKDKQPNTSSQQNGRSAVKERGCWPLW